MSTSFLQLAQDGLVNQSDAKLLHELGERVRVLLHSYFRSPSDLHVSFTHLVCRNAVPGVDHRDSIVSAQTLMFLN